MVIRQKNISHDMTRVRDRRDAQGVSLRSLKTRSGVVVATLARIEADGYAPRLLTLQRLAAALRMRDLNGERPPRPRKT